MINFPGFPTPDNPQPEIGSPQSDATPGRPRALTHTKRDEFITLVTDGLSLEYAAKQVRCSVRTIRRELKRDPCFANEYHYAQKEAQLTPLRTILDAGQMDWRAAKWLLEHLFPEQFARRIKADSFGKPQARRLLNEVLRIVDSEVNDIPQRDSVTNRIRAAFEYFTHVHSDSKRSKADFRRAIELFEKKDKPRDIA